MQFKFFLLPSLTAYEAKYQFASIILAEGFQQLGISFCGNIDYWYEKAANSYLFNTSEDDAEVHVYDWFYIYYTPNSLAYIDKSKINILLDMSDGYLTHALSPAADHFDIILRAHYTKNLPYGKHVYSWPFALSNRIIDAVNATRDQEMQHRALRSYRVNLDLRKLTNTYFTPLLEAKIPIEQFESQDPALEVMQDPYSYWWQTGRRHDEKYFVELNSSMFSLAFGGVFVPRPYPSNGATNFRHLVNRAILKAVPGLRGRGYLQFLVQYDSWRLWESFIANTCPLFLNFEQNGFQFPVNPIAGKHYIDVDLFNFKESVDRICALSDDEVKHIGQQGREWAFEHYSPKAMAQRLLNILDSVKQK